MSRATTLGIDTYLQLGLRNLWRNPRRTLLILASLLVGFGALTFLGAMVDGIQRDLKQSFILILKGHIQIHAQGFEASQQIRHHIANPQAVIQHFATIPDIETWTQRVRTSGMAFVAEASTGVQILGVDPVREARLTRLVQLVSQGTWLPADDGRALLLGRVLADHLGVAIGDKVILMAQMPSGEIATELVRLRGVLSSGARAVDQTLAVVPLRLAQRMLGLGHGITDIVIRATHAEATNTIQRRLRSVLPQTGYEVLGWMDLSPVLQQRLVLGDTFAYLMMFLVVVVVVAEGLNTMLMALHERAYEFGIMEAIGTRKTQLFTMVLWESSLLMMIGCIVGYLSGALAVLYCGRTGIDLSGFAEAFTYMAINPITHPVLTWQTAVNIIGLTFVASLLAAVYPAWKATRLQPVAAMRRT